MTVPTAAAETARLVVFLLDGQRYAVELNQVERVLPMVELSRFPRAPDVVAGVFDLHGSLVPAMNVRRRFGRPERAPTTGDQLLVVRTARRRLALVVDHVEQVEVVPTAEIAPPGAVVPGLEYVKGVVRLPESGIIFVHDLDRFLALPEEEQLEAALRGGRS